MIVSFVGRVERSETHHDIGGFRFAHPPGSVAI
jgi:hypothetical protein